MTTLFLYFFLFLITNLIPAVHSHCIEDQQISLLHFKKSLVFDSSHSSKLLTWNSSTECCSWLGVTCSTNGHVVGLDISSESISCNIDNSSSLFQLQHLERLNLAENDFNRSPIPSAIGKLTNLRYLNLSEASFSGEIPIEISRLTKLVVLDLSYGGEAKNGMLFQNLTELTELNLNGVNLSAQAPHWCQAISSSLLNLRVLSLSNCDLSGPICGSLTKLQSLSEIDLSFYNFYAPVPRLFANFSKLTSLDLGDCILQGTFPKEIFQIPCLQTIDLSLNEELGGSFPEFPKNGSLQSINLRYTKFSGILPNSIGNLKMLSELYLSKCSFTGSVPKSIANLTQLAHLDMLENMFNGPISAIHWESLVNLESLDLSVNLLNGSIPSSIFSLPLLGQLVLSYNQFSGQVPEFSNTSSPLLETLDLGNNNLEGQIPTSIFSLPLLGQLVLSYNLFSGQVPEFSNTSSPLLETLDLGNNNLEGQIPTSIFNLQGLMDLNLSSNNFTGFPFNGLQQPRNLLSLDLSHNSLLFDYNGTGSSFLQIGIFLLASNKLRAFPDFLKNQSKLQKLDLSGNWIQGQIPNWIWRLNSLQILDLSYNSLSTLEAPLANSTSILSSLNLHSNNIQGIHSSFSFLQLQSLDLASNKLRSFPDFLRNQSTLRNLDLSNNQIQGQLPNWIWRIWSLNYFRGRELNLSCNSLETLEAPLLNSTFVVLVLDLHSNQLQGQIPMFVNGPYLDYSRNNFSSSIPTDIGDFISATTYLSLSSNNLHGAIPKSICNASGKVLDLSNNSLSGIIPQCLTQARRNEFYQSLSVLDLRRNNLSGTIPDNFLEDCQLQTLDLSKNQIQGLFSKSLVNCSRLEVLNLGNNQITDIFPCLLMSISTLRVLVLRFNKFYGSIGCPKTNNTWPLLQILDLAHNNLSGEIPGRKSLTWQAMVANKDDSSTNLGFSYSPRNNYDRDLNPSVYYRDAITTIIKGLELDLVKILTIFTLIDFSFNNFNGSIPEEVGQLKSLYVLNLSGNALTGEIPSSFGNMRALESLDLSQNHLSGHIPPQFANLNFLSFLNVSNNQLTGRIPISTQFSTFPKTSFEGNKGLWGPPLTVDTVAVSPPPTSSNPNSGDEIDWDIISVEIGFTCGFGIAVGSLMFCKRWRKWYYRAMCKILFKIFPQLEQRLGNHTRHVYVNTWWRH